MDHPHELPLQENWLQNFASRKLSMAHIL